MRLLVPPGKDSPPPLGGQLMTEASEQGTKMLSEVLLPRVCTLLHCCSTMLNSPYPVQITVPIHHLLTLVGRVLQIDGSLHGSLLPFTIALHQELLSAELPALHLDSLDLLIAIIRGVRSQLLPHAAHIVLLLREYFKRTTMPLIRKKIYSIMQILLISFGVGMVLYLSQDVVNNAFADLNDSPGSEPLSSSIYASKSTCEASQKSSHRKRKHASGSPVEQQNGVRNGSDALDQKMPAPLSVKIAALKALEALLTVGGSLRSECWRSSVDSLLINVATNARDMGWAREGKYPNSSDESPVSQADFQLAALEALLASLLSPTHVRPPYLSQGLKLFHRGKQETGTKLAAFCAHALLALEVLIHPRSLPLMDAPVAKSSSFEEGFNHKHQMSLFSRGNPRTINVLDDINDDDDLYNSCLRNNDESTIDHNVATKLIENNQVQSLRNSVEVAEVEKKILVDDEIIETHREPTLGDQAKACNEDVKFSSDRSDDLGASTSLIAGYEIERGNGTLDSSNDLDKDMGDNSKNLGVLLEDRLPNYGSDSTSIDSLPDIVDVDPDSDDEQQCM